jgi:glutamate/tyrosine decarboxylase-like PLP-dependent enzyme
MSDIDIKSAFLGPKAENQDLYENIIIEVIRDNCFLRKNFHPEDKPIISEDDKIAFQHTSAELKQKLQEILADLKKGVPLYHPRYIGHMHGDLLLPAVAAYFSTMLYNSNNVVGESSPATTKMEFEYIRNLCRMVGYDGFKDLSNDKKENQSYQSWGHLCSGGTSANIEALWLARNLKYYPLSIKLAISEIKNNENEVDKFFQSLSSIFIRFYEEIFSATSYNKLFNLPVSDILEIKREINIRLNLVEEANAKNIIKRIDENSVIELGVHGIHHKIKEKGKEELLLPKLYIAKSYHYSWDKAMDIIGIGRGNMEKINVTDEFSLDIENLKFIINHKRKEFPILAVVGILGSSKQGSIDPIDKIFEFRQELEKKKKSFYFHVDAAYGGYFPSILWNGEKNGSNDFGQKYHEDTKENICLFLSKNDRNSIIEEKIKNRIVANTEKIYPKLCAVKNADSITIDPHKMGYVPYPAGSILYKDTCSKDFVSYEPSYLNKPSEEGDEYTAFLGQWTLEGSRPGAAAAACCLSNRILPFNQKGYGLLVRNTFQMANLFMELIDSFNSDNLLNINRGYKILPIYKEPESNIVEYILVNPGKINKVKYLNILTSKLYEQFSVNGKTIIPSKDYMVAKEDFEEEDIPAETWIYLNEQGNIENVKKEKVIILSSVFMNPLSIYIDKVDEYYMNFFRKMVEYADDIILPEILMRRIIEEHKGDRLKVLWIENEEEVKKTEELLKFKSNIGQFLDIDFVQYSSSTKDKINNHIQEKIDDIIILDLNLNSTSHKEDTMFEDSQESRELCKSMDKERKSKVIFCSKYFQEDETSKEMHNILKNDISFTDEMRMIKKPQKENDMKEIKPLVNAIYKIFSNMAE